MRERHNTKVCDNVKNLENERDCERAEESLKGQCEKGRRAKE